MITIKEDYITLNNLQKENKIFGGVLSEEENKFSFSVFDKKMFTDQTKLMSGKTVGEENKSRILERINKIIENWSL